jgi:hypothetical protein
MTRRYRGSKISAARRALLPIVAAIPLAVAVTCSSATGNAAARPSVPAPAPVGQLWTSPVQPGATAPVPAPGGASGGDVVSTSVTDTMLDQAKNAAAATKASIDGGLRSALVDTGYSDNATGLQMGSAGAGLAIGAVVGAIPGAVVGAIPGALIGAAVGAAVGGIAGGIAMAIPTLGVGAPLGAVGGVLVGAGVGAAVGAVITGVGVGVCTGAVGATAGYLLGAATGIGNGLQS